MEWQGANHRAIGHLKAREVQEWWHWEVSKPPGVAGSLVVAFISSVRLGRTLTERGWISGLFPFPGALAACAQISSHALVKAGRRKCCKGPCQMLLILPGSPCLSCTTAMYLLIPSDCDPWAETHLRPHSQPYSALLFGPVVWH